MMRKDSWILDEEASIIWNNMLSCKKVVKETLGESKGVDCLIKRFGGGIKESKRIVKVEYFIRSYKRVEIG